MGGAGASTPALAEKYLRVQLEQRAVRPSVTCTALPCCTDLPEAHGVGKTLGRGWAEAFSGRTTHIDMFP